MCCAPVSAHGLKNGTNRPFVFARLTSVYKVQFSNGILID